MVLRIKSRKGDSNDLIKPLCSSIRKHLKFELKLWVFFLQPVKFCFTLFTYFLMWVDFVWMNSVKTKGVVKLKQKTNKTIN